MTQQIQEYIRKTKETLDIPSKPTLYYLERFKRIDENPNKFNWNWGALLGGSFWLVYRRMYWQAALLFSTLCILGEAGSYLFQYELTGGGDNALLAIFGNRLYYAHVQHQLKKGKSRGGVDPITPIVLLGLVLAYIAYIIYYGM